MILNKKLSTRTFVLSHITILIAGLGFLAGLYFFLNSDNKVAEWVRSGPLTSRPTSFSLDLTSPDDNILVFEKNVTISGKTTPKASVIISVNDHDLGFEANILGDFSKVISLEPGLNEISINAFDNLGNSKNVQRTIYYSEEKL